MGFIKKQCVVVLLIALLGIWSSHVLCDDDGFDEAGADEEADPLDDFNDRYGSPYGGGYGGGGYGGGGGGYGGGACTILIVTI